MCPGLKSKKRDFEINVMDDFKQMPFLQLLFMVEYAIGSSPEDLNQDQIKKSFCGRLLALRHFFVPSAWVHHVHLTL